MAITRESVFDRFLEPILTPEVARQVVSFELDPDARHRLEVLRQRANEGSLTREDQAEYEQMVESLDLVAILKAKAHAALTRRAS